MKKLIIDDLYSNEVYEPQRAQARKAMIDHKKDRRLALGPNATLHFEDYQTMRHQVQELMRSEQINRLEDIKAELNVYNPLIPDGCNLKVTFMIEYSDETERRAKLAKLIGVEHKISITVAGFEPVYPIANEDLPRSTAEKTSAVHFMRFEFPAETIKGAKAGAAWTVSCEHPDYPQQILVPDNVRKSLLKDFD